MKLLFTSAGRRKYLLDYFGEVFGSSADIHVGNSDPLCPAFNWAGPKVVTPQIFDDSYVDFIYTYCRKHEIRAVIPLFDIDLPVLAAARGRFLADGIEIVVSDVAVIERCNDKLKTVEFLRENGFETLKTFCSLDAVIKALELGQISFPLIIKPRWGMGSIGIFEAECLEELKVFYSKSEKAVRKSYLRFESAIDPSQAILIQEKAIGQEYGLDVVHDLQGSFMTVCVKRKIAMRSGETDIARTENIPELQELGRKLGAALGHRANLDVDLFWDGSTAKVLELNARFGGGYPFSHLSGVDLPRALVAWLRGEKAPRNLFESRPGVVGLKDIHPVVVAQ